MKSTPEKLTAMLVKMNNDERDKNHDNNQNIVNRNCHHNGACSALDISQSSQWTVSRPSHFGHAREKNYICELLFRTNKMRVRATIHT